MRYGLISDIHFGYHSGNKINEAGVNVREQDHYDAAFDAVDNLKAEGVDVILDIGDMAEVPAPRKRALLNLVELVRFAGVPFYSVDGNHTAIKSSNDIHVYDIIANECDNFVGIRVPTYDPYTRVSFVPHSYDNDRLKDSIGLALDKQTEIMVGHWAADDIPYVGQVSRRDLPTGIGVFLGHYHNYRPSSKHNPTYVGSTEKTAWDQWDYPTGCAVYDSDTGEYVRIDIPTRQWANIESTVDDYMEAMESTDIKDDIVRLTVCASPEEYRLVDQVWCKSYARESGAVAFSMRRQNLSLGLVEQLATLAEAPLNEQWKGFAEEADVPVGVQRERVVQIGIDALNG